MDRHEEHPSAGDALRHGRLQQATRLQAQAAPEIGLDDLHRQQAGQEQAEVLSFRGRAVLEQEQLTAHSFQALLELAHPSSENELDQQRDDQARRREHTQPDRVQLCSNDEDCKRHSAHRRFLVLGSSRHRESEQCCDLPGNCARRSPTFVPDHGRRDASDAERQQRRLPVARMHQAAEAEGAEGDRGCPSHEPRASGVTGCAGLEDCSDQSDDCP
mmetsp:Transcript_135154/g.431970  ORF Transcript_135154/g.431970 Transcript_135154/m.431970 type:complete len:216 (+) Transcript_135154:3033-3680(+)